MQYRLKDEYGVETVLTPLPYPLQRMDHRRYQNLCEIDRFNIVQDRQGRPMVLFTSQWEKQYSIKQNPNLKFVDVLV